jgi:hypothetical protein
VSSFLRLCRPSGTHCFSFVICDPSTSVPGYSLFRPFGTRFDSLRAPGRDGHSLHLHRPEKIWRSFAKAQSPARDDTNCSPARKCRVIKDKQKTMSPGGTAQGLSDPPSLEPSRGIPSGIATRLPATKLRGLRNGIDPREIYRGLEACESPNGGTGAPLFWVLTNLGHRL